MLRLVSTQNIFSIVNDQFGRPTSANHISDFIKHIIDLKLYKSKFGLYNFSANGPIITWLGFAQYIFKQAYNMGHISKEPCIKKLKKYEYKATRPKYSALSNARTQRVFKFKIADWRTSTKNEIKSFYKTKE
jgi:dTDP-4-dehydrorhamnose reductase